MNEVIHDDDLRVPVKCWNAGVPFEEEARKQLRNLAKVPCVFRHVAAMPDVHAGFGSTVGSVFATKGAIIPAAVGVDIGCGMVAARTDLSASDLPDNLSGLRSQIESNVPVGAVKTGTWKAAVPKRVEDAWAGLAGEYGQIRERHAIKGVDRAHVQLGTLGGGNHFIEVCLDEDDNVWLMLHSGSRGPGNQIGRHFIELAKREMERWFIQLPDADLAYLAEGSEHYDDYVEAVAWAQRFARLNRDLMLAAVIEAVTFTLGRKFEIVDEAINCHHNYVAMENHFGANVWVTRKGAVRARSGDLGIIPGSMGARSYIVRGLGNRDSFQSCSHGAGRTMSRSAARRKFTAADLAEQTDGIECAKDDTRVDEIPAAYKDIDAVMAAQADLVEPVAVLRQVVCVKG